MKKLLICLLFFPLSLSAQINQSDSLNTQANLSLTGFWQDGNVETKIFRAQSEVSVKLWKGTVFRTRNSYVYQEFGKQKADEDVLSLNFLHFNPEKRFHPFLLGIASSNYRREVDLRLLAGGGVTFQLFDSDDTRLYLSLSTEYERTDYSEATFNRSEYNGMQSFATYRGTIWINGRYRLFDNKIIVSHESYFQPSLEQANNYRWMADAGLELPIWSFMSFTVSYLHTFENIVIENQKREDRFLTFGFTLKSL